MRRQSLRNHIQFYHFTFCHSPPVVGNGIMGNGQYSPAILRHTATAPVKKSKSDNMLDCLYRIDNSPVSPAIQYICRCLYPVGFCFYRKEKRFLGSICHIARYICKNIFNCRTGFLLFLKTQDKILTILFILDDPFIHIPDSFLWIGIYDKPVSGLVYCHHWEKLT